MATIDPSGCNVGSGGEDIDEKSIIGVERSTISDVGCTNCDCLESVRGAGRDGIHVGVTLKNFNIRCVQDPSDGLQQPLCSVCQP